MMNEAADEMAYLEYLGIDIFSTFDFMCGGHSEVLPNTVPMKVKAKRKKGTLIFRQYPMLSTPENEYLKTLYEKNENDPDFMNKIIYGTHEWIKQKSNTNN